MTLPKATIKGGKVMPSVPKNLVLLSFAVVLGIWGGYKIVDIATQEEPVMTKAQAEARSAIMLREPVNCWGDKEGWQCLGQDTKQRWVTCLGTDCYRTK